MKIIITSLLSLALLAFPLLTAYPSDASRGFDANGYNNTARVFVGTGSSWCTAKGMAPNCLGIYSPDSLVMKWNAEWDRGNDEGWTNPPYGAWENNEWNGTFPGGSGENWHYKIVWSESCKDTSTPPEGAYCIWGQFAVIQDQGIDPNVGPGHFMYNLSTPNGYGAAK